MLAPYLDERFENPIAKVQHRYLTTFARDLIYAYSKSLIVLKCLQYLL